MITNNIVEFVLKYLKLHVPNLVEDSLDKNKNLILKAINPIISNIENRVNEIKLSQNLILTRKDSSSGVDIITDIEINQAGDLIFYTKYNPKGINAGSLIDIVGGGAPSGGGGGAGNITLTGFVSGKSDVNGKVVTTRTPGNLDVGAYKVMSTAIAVNDNDLINLDYLDNKFEINTNKIINFNDSVETIAKGMFLSDFLPPLNDIAFNDVKITELADGVLDTDGVNLGQVTTAIADAKYDSSSITDFTEAAQIAAKALNVQEFTKVEGDLLLSDLATENLDFGGKYASNMADAVQLTDGMNKVSTNAAIITALNSFTITSSKVTDFNAAAQASAKLIPLNEFAIPEADLSINSKKLTLVATGTENTDGINLGQMNIAIADAKYTSTSITDFTTAAQIAAKALNVEQLTTINGNLTLSNIATGNIDFGGKFASNIADSVAATDGVNQRVLNAALANFTTTSSKITDFTTAAQTAAKGLTVNQLTTLNSALLFTEVCNNNLNMNNKFIYNLPDAGSPQDALNLRTMIAYVQANYIPGGVCRGYLFFTQNTTPTNVNASSYTKVAGNLVSIGGAMQGFSGITVDKLVLDTVIPTPAGAYRPTGLYWVGFDAAVTTSSTTPIRVAFQIVKNGVMDSVPRIAFCTTVKDNPQTVSMRVYIALVPGDALEVWAGGSQTVSITVPEMSFWAEGTSPGIPIPAGFAINNIGQRIDSDPNVIEVKSEKTIAKTTKSKTK